MATNSPTVATRFLILSDTHNFEFNASGPFQQPVPKVDVLLHCGDLTMCGGLSAYKKCLKMLGSIDAELKLVIAGNHDLSLDKEYWKRTLDEEDDPEEHAHAMEIMTGPLAREAGVTYLEEGTHSFTLKNGAKMTVYASAYQPEFCGWAFAYQRHEDRYNSTDEALEGITSIARNPVPSFPGVDILMTHGPPKGIMDECDQGHVGCENVLQAMSRARPLMHCFGHIHEGHGASKIIWEEKAFRQESRLANTYPRPSNVPVIFGKETLMVNAAIMDGRNQPSNAPWLVDLDLPCSV